MAWFHCGRCASLFRAQAGEGVDRRCSSCGEDPVLGTEAEVPSGAAVKEARDPMLRVKMAEVEKPKVFKREVRHQKGKYFVLKLFMVWALLMGALALCAKLFWSNDPKISQRTETKQNGPDRDAMLIEKEYPKCVRAMSGFIAAGTPEEKNQFVLTPVDTARRMSRFYQANPMNSIDPMSIRGVANGVITLKNDVRLIETRWTVSDGRTIDAVFAQEQGEWRLDWEEYVRYADEPWALFLAGSGDADGEFRLLAREREQGERSSVGDLRIRLHAPVFGHPGEAGAVSHEFAVDQLSSDGRLLIEAFKKRAEGGRIYGSSLETKDPDGMIRVRVKVSRKEGPSGREFRLTSVEACHWLSVDDSESGR